MQTYPTNQPTKLLDLCGIAYDAARVAGLKPADRKQLLHLIEYRMAHMAAYGAHMRGLSYADQQAIKLLRFADRPDLLPTLGETVRGAAIAANAEMDIVESYDFSIRRMVA